MLFRSFSGIKNSGTSMSACASTCACRHNFASALCGCYKADLQPTYRETDILFCERKINLLASGFILRSRKYLLFCSIFTPKRKFMQGTVAKRCWQSLLKGLGVAATLDGGSFVWGRPNLLYSNHQFYTDPWLRTCALHSLSTYSLAKFQKGLQLVE